jgi:hypothetical protein
VAEDAETTGEERLLKAITFDHLMLQKKNDGLGGS